MPLEKVSREKSYEREVAFRGFPSLTSIGMVASPAEEVGWSTGVGPLVFSAGHDRGQLWQGVRAG